MKNLKSVKSAFADGGYPTVLAMPFVDAMALTNWAPGTAIQVEIPGLCPVESLRKRLTGTGSTKKKSKAQGANKKNVVLDPRQLQLAFVEIGIPVREKK